MSCPGYRDTATCQENHSRFIRTITTTEIVWALSNEHGYAHAKSNQDVDPPDVILFWSEEAYARRSKKSNYSEYAETQIALFDFLFRWLPGMSGDGLLAGTNWTGDFVGLESNPYELRIEIDQALSSEQICLFKQQYEDLTRGK